MDGARGHGERMDHPERKWIADYRKGRVEALSLLVEHFRRPSMGSLSE